MNETPVSDHPVDTASVEARHQTEKSVSNRILAYAFLASVVLNIGWVALVSHGNLFGKGTSPLMLHEKPIKVFKPIPVKPRPKSVKPPPPPPKPPKVQPKIKPIVIKPIVQHVRPHPTPPRPVTHPTPPRPATHPTPPRPASHAVSVHTTTNSHATSKLTAPSAPPSDNQAPFAPNPGPPVPPAPTPTPVKVPSSSAPPTPAKPAPAKSPPPAPPAPVVHHPSNWVPIDSQQASLPDGVFDKLSFDDLADRSTTNDKVLISFTIDETGHVRNARIKESCGNSEIDNRVLEAVQRAHGTPAVQDHIPHDQPETVPFTVGN